MNPSRRCLSGHDSILDRRHTSPVNYSGSRVLFYAHLVVWTFNLVVIGCELILLLAVSRARSIWAAAVGFVFVSAVVLWLAFGFGRDDHFLSVRLLAYYAFAHVPLVLIAVALLLRHRRYFACVLMVFVGILIAVAVDAFLIEPNWLAVSHVQLSAAGLSQKTRIAIIADLQTDRFGEYEASVFRRCMEFQPDMILMAGDYVQVDNSAAWGSLRRQINAFLKKIRFSAPMGIYAVQGNTDHPNWSQIFEGLPVQVMGDTSAVTAGPIVVTGLQVMDSFDRHLRIAAKDGYHIVLGHAPDFALGDVDADLLIAGHTHGGQVRLPGLGPIMTASAVPREWAVGVTQISQGKQLIVSRGIGMERRNAPRLRFLCRPELVIVDLQPTATRVVRGLP